MGRQRPTWARVTAAALGCLLGVAGASTAHAQSAALYVPDAMWAAEDLFTSSDEDQNDVALRYNARCLIDTVSETLTRTEIHFTPATAGARLTNGLVLRFPSAPDRVTVTADGAPVTSCSDGACATSLPIHADFRDGFVGAPVGFVNTEGGPLVAGRKHVVIVEHAPGTPAATDGAGAVTCAPPDFAIERDGLVLIDRTSVLPDNGQPLVGDFADFCPVAVSCPPSALVPWAPPTERVAVSDAYGAAFLSWVADITAPQPCTPGACADEDWFQHPVGSVVASVDVGVAAPLDPAPSCADTFTNAEETDIDCGGVVCGPCGDGDACDGDTDCTSGVCDAFVCAAPSCIDGVLNGDESDLDCGGSCGPCDDGDACVIDDDCASWVCDGDTCAVPTCSDGVTNGTETDVDCGGACGDCALYAACEAHSDCASGLCSGTCQAAVSCQALITAAPSTVSGTYPLDPDGPDYGASPATAWCDMTTGDAGWTLVAKIGTGTTWQYSATFWTVAGNAFNASDFSLTSGEAKFPAFDTVAYTSMRILDPASGRKMVLGDAATSVRARAAGGSALATVVTYDANVATFLASHNPLSICNGNQTGVNNNPGNHIGYNRTGTYVSQGNTATGFARFGTWASGSDSHVWSKTSDCAFGIGLQTYGYGGYRYAGTSVGSFTTVWVR